MEEPYNVAQLYSSLVKNLQHTLYTDQVVRMLIENVMFKAPQAAEKYPNKLTSGELRVWKGHFNTKVFQNEMQCLLKHPTRYDLDKYSEEEDAMLTHFGLSEYAITNLSYHV